METNPIPSDFDLAAYLARIGLKELPAADADGLVAVQRAQRLAIPFENLDIRLGRGISLDPDAVFDKLVRRRRGGYCFEQNGLFLAALTALGFEARPLLARTWIGGGDTPGKTHMINLVMLDGEEWIADAGFGGSYTPPMRLRGGEEITTSDGARHRVRSDDVHGWMVERVGDAAFTDGRRGGEGFLAQYSFTLAQVFASDLDLSNHWTATAADSRFTRDLIVSIVLPNGFASLMNRSYSRSSAKGDEKAEITSAKALQLRLSLVFGIDLVKDEIDRLGLF